MKKQPVAYLMVDRNDGNSYIQMGVPTRDEKISHQPYPLYTHPAETITLAELRETELYRKEQTRSLREFLEPKELTDEEILEISNKNYIENKSGDIEFARAIMKRCGIISGTDK